MPLQITETQPNGNLRSVQNIERAKTKKITKFENRKIEKKWTESRLVSGGKFILEKTIEFQEPTRSTKKLAKKIKKTWPPPPPKGLKARKRKYDQSDQSDKTPPVTRVAEIAKYFTTSATQPMPSTQKVKPALKPLSTATSTSSPPPQRRSTPRRRPSSMPRPGSSSSSTPAANVKKNIKTFENYFTKKTRVGQGPASQHLTESENKHSS